MGRLLVLLVLGARTSPSLQQDASLQRRPPALLGYALPPALPNSTVMLSGTGLGKPGLSVRWCAYGNPSCVSLAPVFADNGSVAFRVPAGSAAVASVAACSPAAVCGDPVFGINAPNVSWISTDGPRNSSSAGTPVALPGTTLRLLGRALAWVGNSCDGLRAPADSSSYAAVRAAAFAVQSTDRRASRSAAAIWALREFGATSIDNTSAAAVDAGVAVSLRSSDGSSVPLPLRLASCFRVDAGLPEGLSPGNYTVMLNNGLTSALPVGRVAVATPTPWPTVVFAPGGPHCASIPTCVAAATAAGGGTVKLGPGVFNLTTSLALGSRVTLQGAGANETVLFWDSHWMPPVPPHCNAVSGNSVCGCHDDGGTIELACPDPQSTIDTVVFASIGNPTGGCGNFSNGSCAGDPAKARAAVEAACVGKHRCSLECDIQHFNGGTDPCYGVAKRVRVAVTCKKADRNVLESDDLAPPAALVACTSNARIAGLTVRSTLRSASVGVSFEPGSENCTIESSRIEIDAPGYPITNAFSAVSSSGFAIRDVDILHDNGGQGCGSWPSQCAIFIATSAAGVIENVSVVASCAGYSIDSSQSLFLDRVATLSTGNVSSEGQGFSSFRKPQLVEHIYQGRGLDIGNPFAAWVDTTNPQHKNSQGRNEAMTLDGPYGLYLGGVDSDDVSFSADGALRLQHLRTASPPPFAMPGRITAVGAAAIIMQGVGLGMVSRVVAVSSDLRTYTISPPFEQPLDNSSVLSVVSYRGASIWEANAYLNATAFQLFGTSLDVVSAGNYFHNATSGMESFGLYYQGGWQPNYGVLFDGNTLRCTGIDPPYFFRYGVGLGTNSLGYAGCRICRPPPVNFDGPYNRLLHFRRNVLSAGTPMKILGRTENCVLDQNEFLSATCGAGTAAKGNLTVDSETTRGIVQVAIAGGSSWHVPPPPPPSPAVESDWRWRQREQLACRGVLPANHSAVPCLLVPACSSGEWGVASGFRRNGDNSSAAQSTRALLCHDFRGLLIEYTAIDNAVASNFSHCQDHVWQMDALELMIYPGALSADPGGNYSEIDLSPHNALWAGRIQNPTGFAPLRNLTVPIPCYESGIRWSANVTESGWNASLSIPWAVVSHPDHSAVRAAAKGRDGGGVIGAAGKMPGAGRIWRANLARFDTPRVRCAVSTPVCEIETRAIPFFSLLHTWYSHSSAAVAVDFVSWV
jgi:hypothetical protein